MEEDYEPFGDEWKKAMMRTTKAFIVDRASDIGKENERLKELLRLVYFGVATIDDTNEVEKIVT